MIAISLEIEHFTIGHYYYYCDNMVIAIFYHWIFLLYKFFFLPSSFFSFSANIHPFVREREKKKNRIFYFYFLFIFLFFPRLRLSMFIFIIIMWYLCLDFIYLFSSVVVFHKYNIQQWMTIDLNVLFFLHSFKCKGNISTK